MTNEELAKLIQEGNQELRPVLWQKVDRLLYAKAAAFYNRHTKTCERCGVELSDIRQECYIVYLEAVKAYKPEHGLMFTTYLDYPFRNAVNSLLGLRTSRQQNEPLNRAASLDKPIETADGDPCTLMDMVQDDTGTDFLERIENADEAACVRRAVENLPEPLRTVVRGFYLEGRQLQALGKEMGLTPERIRQYKTKGLQELRKSKLLRGMYREQYLHTEWVYAAKWEYSPEHYDLIQHLRGQELSYGQKKAELYGARERWIKEQEKMRDL